MMKRCGYRNQGMFKAPAAAVDRQLAALTPDGDAGDPRGRAGG